MPVGTFTDVLSGRRDDRKEYRRMVDCVVEGDVIVVQFLDRFGRNPREILRRYWDLEERGVSVVATDEDIKEELLLLVKAGMAGAESRRISERVRANMSRAVSKGVHAARPPYGLRPVREVKEGKVVVHWELDPIEAPVVREMYRFVVEENKSYKSTADRLSAMGYRARGGRPLAAFTIQRVLSNPAIMGTLIYGRKSRKGNQKLDMVTVPDFFPAILTKEEWQRLQERLNIRRETPKGKAHSSVYLLSGIVRCGHCGGPMVGRAGSQYKDKRYRNYWCSRAMKSRDLCSVSNGHSVPKLEKAILEYLGQFSDPEIVREHLSAVERKDLKRYESELLGVEKRLAELDAQSMKRLDDLLKRGILTEQEFSRANQTARNEAKALEDRRTELADRIGRESDKAALAERVPTEIKTFLEAFEGMDIRQQKAHLQTILKAAHVYRDGHIELEFRQ